MHAIIIGATGATGIDLLDQLLKDGDFHQVDIFVRRKPDQEHQKLFVYTIDFDKPEKWKHLVKGDVLFSCMGTTLKAAGSKEAQWKIDYDYQYQFAKAARENNVPGFVLVSSSFASPNSLFFYAKMKGKLETAVKALAFPNLTILNPPILVRKNTDRLGEVTGLKLIRFFNKLGLFRSQKPLPTEILASVMVSAAKSKTNGITILKSGEIWDFADRTG